MKKKIAVLGAGLVGKAIALDLARDFQVTSADIRDDSFGALQASGVGTEILDFNDKDKLRAFVSTFDLVVGAVPGFMGFGVAQAVVQAGKNMVDISFFPEDPFLLDEEARRKQVTLVTDCGVAPGMGNILLGYHNKQMKVLRYECLVGGLPVARTWPWEYKAVFSPIDVIEEYVRPARYVQNGAIVVREALSDPELIDFEGIGTLESWNSDGLRTLIQTMPHIPDMIEKTLRYPGTIEYLRLLRESGFFSQEPIDINGTSVRPIDVTARLLFPQWKLKPGEREFTVMRIQISGEQSGAPRTWTYNLLDHTDVSSGTLSMARTTGYTCTAAVHLVANGSFNRKGVCPPEYLGEDEAHYKFILDHLAQRGVRYDIKSE
jgi:lysine 6-dehydrogenase